MAHTKNVRRFVASYLRHVAAVVSGVSAAGAIGDSSLAYWQQFGISLAAGALGPLAKLFMDTADDIDPDLELDHDDDPR